MSIASLADIYSNLRITLEFNKTKQQYIFTKYIF